MPPPADLDRLSHAELKSLVLKLLEEVADLRRTVAALRDEIARLKGGPGRPNIKPSGMDKATDPKPPPTAGGEPRPKGDKTAKLSIDEERTVKVTAPPHGSRFKGYTSFIVQDLVIRPHVVNFRRERWQTPDGEMLTAPLPAGISGHFGPELRRFVLLQCHQGQVTVPRLFALLRVLGIDISKRQLVRLLIAGQDGFLTESRDVLRAGLASAAWITVDDTGARHKAANGFCTQIGNPHFAWFGTTASKSRGNFLELLRAGHGDYVINAEALAYMRRRVLAAPAIARLAEHADRFFPDQAAFSAYLDRLGIAALGVKPDPVMVATEGALWGSVKAHGFLPNTVIVSDDAGQFNVGHHGLCWVHAERLVHKLDTFTDEQRVAQRRIRALIWRFYRALKAYRRHPTTQRKAVLQACFDRIFTHRTGFVTLDRLLARLHANKAELLMVLERPDIPLHTNGSENDIRCQVTKRKISGGTRSDAGRDCRDAFLGLAKTCAKLGITFWDYLGARLAVPNHPDIPYLPQIIRHRCASG
jgi:transposase IS66 family protein